MTHAATQPVPPPRLRGYVYRGELGTGTTAVVYRYWQIGTQREVAVKVSKTQLNAQSAARFQSEANFMAKISAHPYILSIIEAGIANDGRSFIVFEYAPGGNMKDLLATRTLPADQVLDIGVNIASALYTAHRAGIVHRDIKTSNILITEQGLPALADFGIAASVYDHRSTGYSLPWAPPEVLASRGSGTEASDLYSLAATLYALIVGSSPFEYGYHPRTAQELTDDIMHKPVPRMNRSDVPAAVEHVLARAMAHHPEERYPNVLAFARALQQAQMECYGYATPVTVEGVDQFERTLVPRASGRDDAALTDSEQHRNRRSWWVIVAIIAAVALIGAVIAGVVLPRLDRHETQSTTIVNPSESPKAPDDDAMASSGLQVPAPTQLVGSYHGDSVTFTWTNPDPKQGDRYAWSIIDGGVSGSHTTNHPSVTVGASEGTQTCIQVSIVRHNRQMSEHPATVCATR